ncbi:MAG: ribonuclease P protein component [Gammaproteobacteria bacterium]
MKFNKSFRLLCARDYDIVFQQAIKINHPLASIYARPNVYSHARLGLLVSKKAMKRAVARNRIKRLVRESFRAHVTQLKAYDIIFVARSKIEAVDNKEVFNTLDELWTQLT